jgi:hypothetical protein
VKFVGEDGESRDSGVNIQGGAGGMDGGLGKGKGERGGSCDLVRDHLFVF